MIQVGPFPVHSNDQRGVSSQLIDKIINAICHPICRLTPLVPSLPALPDSKSSLEPVTPVLEGAVGDI